ncbi:MAG TPA: hypothetical protein EYP49_20235 [Anaerolineae bacterium]|nr:hypothetical protein [Anaerolineae bacterium]
MTADQIWQAALGELQLQMTKATFDTWVKNTRAISHEGGIFVIGVHDALARDWLENRLLTTVERTLVGIIGHPVEVEFAVLKESTSAESRGQRSATSSAPPTRGREAEEEIALEPIYATAASAIIRPELNVATSLYSVQKWLPLLGVQRWTLVQVLRCLCVHSPRRPDGTKWLTTTWKELAGLLGVDRRTIGQWLAHEPIPDQRPWHRLVPSPGEETAYLGYFIPRLKYAYVHQDGVTRRQGFVLEILMEDPLVPADRALLAQSPQRGGYYAPIKSQNLTLPSRSVKSENITSHSAVESDLPTSQPDVTSGSVTLQSRKVTEPDRNVKQLTTYITGKLNLELTGKRQIRKALKPVVSMAEAILDDYHSTAMLYKVLLALYPDHLDIFLQAIEEAVGIGEADSEANLGALFVSILKELAAEVGVDLGFKSG